MWGKKCKYVTGRVIQMIQDYMNSCNNNINNFYKLCHLN